MFVSVIVYKRDNFDSEDVSQFLTANYKVQSVFALNKFAKKSLNCQQKTKLSIQ